MISKKRSGFQITSVTLDYGEESKKTENREVELANGVPGHAGSGSTSASGRVGVASPGKTVLPLTTGSSLVSQAGARFPDSHASPQEPQGTDGAGSTATLLQAVPPRMEVGPKSPPKAGGASQQAGGMCGSRFRVVKLDHISDEPYHRGRWTCTDLRDRELPGHILTRVLDGGRHVGSLDSHLDFGGLAHRPVGQLEPKLQLSEPRSTPVSPPSLSRNNSPPRKILPSEVNVASSLRLISPMQTLATSMLSVGSHHDGEDESGSSSSMVAIDNKIEQAMDLVKSHLMYAVREEVEVLKEQIKELIDRNSLLERENALLKSLVSSEQLTQIQGPSRTPGGSGGPSSAANPSNA
ncbi:TSC22 domain family protein 4-like [Narcine bancroftii]|uniref:TSC22 domain family protein 4-like n=1 Tax=Narcine bancroftii TaxID=1343680 RepID=UPI003831CEFB